MPFTKLLCTLLLFFCSQIAGAQNIWFQKYTIRDGLVDNQIRNIYQDKKGFIWIGTWEGISRYDGYKFTNFSTYNGLSHDVINDILEYGNGIYIALNDGSVDYIEKNRVTRKEKFKTPLNKFLKLPNGKVIIPTDENGIYEFNKGQFQRPKQEDPKLNSQVIVPLNDSLFLSVDAGTSSLTLLTNDYQKVQKAELYKLVIVINSIYKDSFNRIWLCTDKGLRLIKYDEQNKSISVIQPPPNLISEKLINIPSFSILESDEGGYWIGNWNGLIRSYSSAGYTIFNEIDGIPNASINAIFADREKNIWIGTSKGLLKINTKNNIQNLNSRLSQAPGSVYAVDKIEDRKFIIRNSSQNLKVFDTDSKKIEEVLKAGAYNSMFYFPGSDPWIFYNTEGFYAYDSKHKKAKPILKRTIVPNYLGVTDNNGISFIGLSEDIGILSGKNIWIKKLAPNFRITAMTIHHPGELWIGTWKNGLYRIQYTVTRDSIDFKVRNYSNLIPDSAIRSLYTDKKGNLWVGTRNKGIIRIFLEKDEKFNATVFDKKSGLNSNFILAIAESEDGDIWLGSPYGLEKMIKTKTGYRIFNFSKINNFLGRVSQIIPFGKNEYWCILDNNLMKFTDQYLDRSVALTPVITNVRLGNNKEEVNYFNPDTTVSLAYSKNKVQFEFSVPSFINEKQVLFSYRLFGGNDSTWSDPNNIHEVSYANLQPGHYNFEVRTMGWNNEYGEPAIFKFEITPPFWQTWWFYALCIISVILFFFSLYRYRLKQILKIQAVRNRIATDLHDDIGSNLTTIGLLAELTQKDINDQNTAAKHLQRIAEEINESGQALDDIIWNINSRNDSLDEIIIRMRRYAAELFDHTATRCQLALQPGVAHIKVGMEQRRDLYLIYKESLNNIFKHAKAKNVEVELKYAGQQINLLIRDDGVGFDTNGESHRNGIKNFKLRVEKWNGSILISSRKNEGTTIDLEMPVA